MVKYAILKHRGEKLGKELIWNHESRSESLSDELSTALCGKIKVLRILKEEKAVAGSMFLLTVKERNMNAEYEDRYLMLHVFIKL